MMVGPTVLMVSIGTGAPLRIDSSKKMNCSMAERPWPPHSLGQPMPSQPSAPICLTTWRTVGPDAVRLRQLLLQLGREQVVVVGAQLALQRLLLLGVGRSPWCPSRAAAASAPLSTPRRRRPGRAVPCAVEHVTVRPRSARPMGRPDGAVRLPTSNLRRPRARSRASDRIEEPVTMPEAVIVATGRTPIGRANKGSLVECRPDDLSRAGAQGRAGQGAAAQSRRRRGRPARAAGSRPARRATTSPASPPSWPGWTTFPASR